MKDGEAVSEMETQTRVLIVEDIPFDSELMRHALIRGGIGCVTQRVETEPEFRDALEKFKPEIILADYSLPRFSGTRAFQIVQDLGLETPVIVVSGMMTEDIALRCLQDGAADYVPKDNLLRLGTAVKLALERSRDPYRGRGGVKLGELFTADTVRLNLEAKTGDDALRQLISLLSMGPESADSLFHTLQRREILGSTGVGSGFAIPHARSLVVSKLRVAYAHSVGGIEFQASDRKPVHDFFLIVSPRRESSPRYLPVLGRIAEFVNDPEFPGRLRQVKTPAEFLLLMQGTPAA